MTSRAASSPRTRAELRAADGVLVVWRPPPPKPLPAPGQPPAVTADPAEGHEPLLAVWDDGSVTALHGHVDLGTGLATALGQIVAEELELAPGAVQVVLGHTAIAPNQGATIASASIQVHADPLRRAAAQARAWLVAESTRVDRDHAHPLSVDPRPLLAGRHVDLALALDTPVKAPADYRVVGTAQPRTDLPPKAAGELVFVHDMRVPGMLHGRVVRPPYAGLDAGDFVGNTLRSVDEGSIAHIAGIRAVVVIRDFVGVVAEREEQAERAMRELRVEWHAVPAGTPLDDLAGALKAHPATRRVLVERGDVDGAIAGAAQPMAREYVWPYQLHASIGPSCALAHWRGDGDPSGLDPGATAHDPSATTPGPALTVWAGTQNPHVLRADLATLTGLPAPAIDVVRMEAAGCYGRNGADDVAADAVLLSRAVGAPVRVQLTREQEHLWEPKGAAQLMQVDGGLDADGRPVAYDFRTSYPSNGAPTLALLLTRTIEPVARAFEMGDRTAVPPYDFPALRVVAHDMAPILRASWLRGVSALPNSFAHESYVDELATAAGADPVDFRLARLPDERAAELVRATAERAGWIAHAEPRRQAPDGDWLKGQGFAYARYSHSRFPGFGAAWAAWVADVEVHRTSGEVHVARVVVGHDAGLEINPAGVRHQVHGNVLQATSRALKEALPLDPVRHLPAAREWGAYPILTFREVPVVEVLAMPRPGEPPLGAGESASVPGTAAIANAIFDATGVRFRQPPFTPEVVRAGMRAARFEGIGDATGDSSASPADRHVALDPIRLSSPVRAEPVEAPAGHRTADDTASLSAPARAEPVEALPATPADSPEASTALDPATPSAGPRPPEPHWPPSRRRRDRLGLVAAAALGLGAALLAPLLGGRGAIAPIASGSTAGVYSADTIERGRVLAAAGNCIGCHTAPGGAPYAGGRALETPFGAVIATNLTPDPATGIGTWSYAAFERAMREGRSRDGQRLYPAFPYTAFTRTTDADLTALYAWLMAQPPVAAAVPPTRLAFPFSVRPLLAAWNALNLTPGPVADDPGRPPAWNRGAYLVNGLGHCGACHTPRDALGAERPGTAYLAGAMVDGWEAPALTTLASRAPIPWTAAELYAYLRHGHSSAHGSAAGPMAPVVRELGALPDADIRAMATYLASFNSTGAAAPTPEALVARTTARADTALPDATERLFTTACGACHHAGDGPQLLGQNIPLALNTNLHSDRPDNVLRVILDGIQTMAGQDQGFMPGFRHQLDDAQVARLAAYLRQRFAPDEAPWDDLARQVARVRANAPH